MRWSFSNPYFVRGGESAMVRIRRRLPKPRNEEAASAAAARRDAASASAPAPPLEPSNDGAAADARNAALSLALKSAMDARAAAEIKTAVEAQARSIHWFPYDPVRVVNADP